MPPPLHVVLTHILPPLLALSLLSTLQLRQEILPKVTVLLNRFEEIVEMAVAEFRNGGSPAVQQTELQS
jgi:hypothetical protein